MAHTPSVVELSSDDLAMSRCSGEGRSFGQMKRVPINEEEGAECSKRVA